MGRGREKGGVGRGDRLHPQGMATTGSIELPLVSVLQYSNISTLLKEGGYQAAGQGAGAGCGRTAEVPFAPRFFGFSGRASGWASAVAFDHHFEILRWAQPACHRPSGRGR